MAISNTSILIKRSLSTATPTSLKQGELGFSYNGNTLFIGTADGTGVLAIGSNNTFSTINSATASNVASALVKRNAEGAFFGRLFGVANSAVQLDTAQNFSISGGDIAAGTQSFNGTGAVVLNASLNSVPGLSAGSYGSSTAVPVIQVGANGRVLGISTSSITTSFTVAGDSGTQTVNGGDTLTLAGGAGITSTASATDTVTFDVDTTVLRSNTNVGTQQIQSGLVIAGNTTVTGNLVVVGNVITQGVTDLVVNDPIIYLAANNYYSDVVDIGFAANYFDGTWERHTGVFRDSTNKEYYVFDNYLPELSGNNNVDTANSSFRLATLNANVKTHLANVSTSLNPTYLSQGPLLNYDGKRITTLANTGIVAGTYGSQSYTQVTQVDAYGRVVALTNTAISIDASQIGAGTLGIARGGTNQTTFTPGSLTFFNGTSLASFANSTYTLTGALSAAKTITSLTVDAYGRVTAATGADIAIDTSQITSGTLGVTRGGTGAATFTTKGIIYGNGTGALQVTAAADTSDQTWSNQILTVTNAGVPVWATNMDGGTF